MGLITKGNDMRYAIPTCAVAALLAAAPVLAADAPAKEESPWTLTSNIALTNAYFFRGLNYTRESPAVQGGFDLAHSSGFYVGTWASNVDSNAFPNANVEVDLYGGLAKSVGEVLVDVGVLQFFYPRGSAGDTTELYAGATWKILNVKYSRAVSEYFGVPGSEGSGYLEGNVNYEVLPSWVLNAHVGHQYVADDGKYASGNAGNLGFTQYRAGITKNFDGGWSLSLQGILIDAKDKTYLTDFGCVAPATGSCKSLMDLPYQVTVKRVF